MLCYFDTSILLAILLDEARGPEALDLWRGATVRISSILIRLESITVLRRTYERDRARLKPSWLTRKKGELGEYLQEISVRNIDEDIEKAVFLKKELARCRTLDAIHLATAWDMAARLPGTELTLFTFDRDMAELAALLKFKTNAFPDSYGV